ncbi:MAG: hypothetical protein BAJALOKI1v1_380010 [Promethearchaeota archaeon]|nr:MAG: hypothetical protein BAJALOKI1v1_380010 [Candidatus Lokiarchaeota archaeon]
MFSYGKLYYFINLCSKADMKSKLNHCNKDYINIRLNRILIY